MRLYRNIGAPELNDAIMSGVIEPREFTRNSDSDCSLEKVSFWFLGPITLRHAVAIVRAEVPEADLAVGHMRFSHKLEYPHGRVYSEYQIEEAYVIRPVSISQIWINEDFEFDPMDIDIETVRYNPWVYEEAIQEQIKMLPRVSTRNPKPPWKSIFEAAERSYECTFA